MSMPVPHRVAVLSLHTSPLSQPGTGDAGGMNVYIAQTARRLAARGVEVEIFTRATGSDQPPHQQIGPGVSVRHVIAGPFDGLAKDDLPGQLCAFAAGVLRPHAHQTPGFYGVVHSHYWLSGQVGFLVKDRWAVPLVHSAHTLGKVKNAALARGDRPEPRGRIIGEEQVIAEADRLVANTEHEAAQLVELYGAERDRIDVIPPGVDTGLFRPGSQSAARAQLGLGRDDVVLAFVGRIQPLKGPDVLVAAAARLARRRPDRTVRVIVVGGVSGTAEYAEMTALASDLGVPELVRPLPPMPPEQLLTVYRAADLVAVPSYNESFGLVALEAQASGTPVVAADVGGLTVAVADGVSGVLVPGHSPEVWAQRLAEVAMDPQRRAMLAAAAPAHARRFSWDATVDGLVECYRRAAWSAVPVQL